MSVIDDYQTVSDKESFAMARRLTREEGLFVGGSSGLITHRWRSGLRARSTIPKQWW